MSRSLQPSSTSSQRFAGRSTLVASAIVALGVAADNVASASEFFRHLPPDTAMAFVVVALQPSSSAAVAALARATPMKVTDVRPRTRPRPNHVYWLGRDRSFGGGLRRVGAAHAPDVRHILRLPTDDREVLRAEQHSLATVNEELESLLDSLDLPMVIVDAERCVRRFTSSARRMVNVIASDIGRPIGDIRWNVSVDDVDEIVRRAAESGTMAQREVRDRHGRYNVLTVPPYRAPGSSQPGAVITLVDIDAHAAARSAGTLAMREHVNQLGGEFDIHFTDHGTAVRVRVPPQEGNR